MTDEDLLAAGEGTYSHIKHFPDGECACVARMVYTCAILYKFDHAGHARRWCYHTKGEAVRALEAWDGAAGTQPEGWFRDPVTGMRVHDVTGEIYFHP